MDDSLILKDVDLFNAGNSVHSKPLQGVLQPLVISGSGFVYRFFLSVEFRVAYYPLIQMPTRAQIKPYNQQPTNSRSDHIEIATLKKQGTCGYHSNTKYQ